MAVGGLRLLKRKLTTKEASQKIPARTRSATTHSTFSQPLLLWSASSAGLCSAGGGTGARPAGGLAVPPPPLPPVAFAARSFSSCEVLLAPDDRAPAAGPLREFARGYDKGSADVGTLLS